jgi:hypothetical protein
MCRRSSDCVRAGGSARVIEADEFCIDRLMWRCTCVGTARGVRRPLIWGTRVVHDQDASVATTGSDMWRTLLDTARPCIEFRNEKCPWAVQEATPLCKHNIRVERAVYQRTGNLVTLAEARRASARRYVNRIP